MERLPFLFRGSPALIIATSRNHLNKTQAVVMTTSDWGKSAGMTEGSRRDQCFSLIGKKDTTQDKCQGFFSSLSKGLEENCCIRVTVRFNSRCEWKHKESCCWCSKPAHHAALSRYEQNHKRTKSTIYHHFFPCENISHCIYILIKIRKKLL